MNIILFGAPGAGKGTQSQLLIEKMGMYQISTGDLLRSAIKSSTELGMKAQGYMSKGELVPDAVVIGMVQEALEKGLKSFILDGFPRTVAQAEALEKLVSHMGLKIDKAIFLEVPQAILEDRLTGRRVCKNCGTVYHIKTKAPQKEGVCDACGGEVYQRNDDKADVIGNRLKAYEEFTSPLKEYYKRAGKYAEVNGNRGEIDIFADIRSLVI